MTVRRIHGAPRVPSLLVPRPHLTGRIAGGAPITIVRGVAGSGKTSLLVEWSAGALEAETGGIWIAVTSAMDTREALWTAVALALDDSGIVPGGAIMATMAEALTVADDVTALMRRAFTQLGGSVVIVLDDAHHLSDEALDDVAQLTAALPEVRFIVSTTRVTDLESFVTRSRVDVEIIEPPQLLFTHAETRAVLGEAAGHHVDTVFDVAEGHALATRTAELALAHVQHGLAAEAVVELLHGALQPQVIAAIDGVAPAGFLDFAMRTSVAEVLTHDLARQLSGRADADALLDTAELIGLGMRTQRPDGDVFTYNTVVRAILAREAEDRLPGERRALVATVARWSLWNMHPLDALRHAVAVGDFELVELVLRRNWIWLLSQHGSAVRALFRPVSLTTLGRHPLVTMMLGFSYSGSVAHRAKASEMLALSIVSSRLKRLKHSDDAAVLRVMESAALRMLGQVPQAASTARSAAPLLDDLALSQRDSLRFLLPVLHVQLGLSFMSAGKLSDAIAQWDQARSASIHGRPRSGLHPLALIAGVRALQGDIPEAIALGGIIREQQWPDGWIDGYSGTFYQVSRAVLALESGDPVSAERSILSLGRYLTTTEHWQSIAHVQALIDLMAGRAHFGLERLSSTIALHASRSSGYLHTVVAAARSILLLATGDPVRAMSVLNGPTDAWTEIARARVALITGDADDALRLLAKARVAGFASARPRAEHAVIEVAALLRVGRDVDAEKELGRMLALLDERQQRLALMLIPRPDLDAIAALARRGHAVLWQQLVGESMILSPLVRLRPAPSLTEREQEVLRLLVADSTTAQIAETLFVSPHTVKSQLRSLYRKLGVSSREAAVAAALRHSLIEAPAG